MAAAVKTYKFRIYPTKTQEVFLAKSFGCCRFIYNYFLQRRIEEYRKGNKKYKYYDCCKELTQLKKKEEFSWLKEVSNPTLQQTLINLESAYKRFFKKISRFPRFKSRKSKQSFRHVEQVSIKNNKLYIPKVREGIKIVLSRKIEGKIKNVTITKTKTNKYFACLCCEVDQKPLEKLDTKIGLDLGIKTLITDSNGLKIENPKILSKFEKKLKYLNRQLSKKKKGSNAWNTVRLKLAGVYEKVKNIREDYIHKISHRLINENQVICIEDLSSEEMLGKNKNINRSIYDASLYELKRQLDYKSLWYGRDLIKVDKYFPSSQLCNSCNYRNYNLKLIDRTWKCPSCNIEHDRDINAAKNILREGLRIHLVQGFESDAKQKQVEPPSCGLFRNKRSSKDEAVIPEIPE